MVGFITHKLDNKNKISHIFDNIHNGFINFHSTFFQKQPGDDVFEQVSSDFFTVFYKEKDKYLDSNRRVILDQLPAFSKFCLRKKNYISHTISQKICFNKNNNT